MTCLQGKGKSGNEDFRLQWLADTKESEQAGQYKQQCEHSPDTDATRSELLVCMCMQRGHGRLLSRHVLDLPKAERL